MAINIHEVDADLKKFAAAIGVDLGLAIEKVATDLHTKIVKRTPVDTGRARASWDATVGEPSDYVPAEDDTTEKPFAPGKIDGTKPVFIVSNLVYIEALENGHSGQAPNGMVSISVAESKAEIDTLLQALDES